MSDVRQEIYDAISRERDYQDSKWGVAHDSQHTVAEFILIIESKLSDAKRAWMKQGDAESLCEILQAVSVGVACLEVYGCHERK